MISLIIPTLNEQKNIKFLVKKIEKIKIISQIIFVDDDSDDRTVDEISFRTKFNKKFSIILRNNKKRNLSESVLDGIKMSKNNYIAVMDADLQHNPLDIVKMYNLIKNNNLDIAIGSRFCKDNFSGNLSFFRSITSRFTIFIIHFFLKKITTDPLSGIFLCKKFLVLKYYNKFYLKGFKILFDIIYNGKKHFKCKDLSINFNKRKKNFSKFNLKIIIIFIIQFIFTCKKYH
jgi:dolichol-phosphate mannosyltransferase